MSRFLKISKNAMNLGTKYHSLIILDVMIIYLGTFIPQATQILVQGVHQMIQLQYSTRLQRMLRLDVRQTRALAESLDFVRPQTIRSPTMRAAECTIRLRKPHFRAQGDRYTCAAYQMKFVVRKIELGKVCD